MTEFSTRDKLSNAKRLIRDAEYLVEGLRYLTAVNLIVLALEQIGHVLLVIQKRFDPKKDRHQQNLEAGVRYLFYATMHEKPFSKMFAEQLAASPMSNADREKVKPFLNGIGSDEESDEFIQSYLHALQLASNQKNWLDLSIWGRRDILHKQRLSYLYGDPLPEGVPDLTPIEFHELINDVKAALSSLEEDINARRINMAHAADDAELPGEDD